MQERFRLRSGVRREGWLCLLGALPVCAMGLSLLFGIVPAKLDERHANLFIGGLMFIGALVSMSRGIYLLRAVNRQEVAISTSQVEMRFSSGECAFDLADVDHLHWRANSVEGWILLKLADQKRRIALAWYEKADQLKMIEYFHRNIPADRQENWPGFCRLIALPLREGERPIQRRIAIAERIAPEMVITITRKRYDKVCIPLLIVAAGTAAIIWNLSATPQAFLLVLPLLLWYLVLRFSTPPHGKKMWSISGNGTGRLFLVVLMVGGFGLSATLLLQLPGIVAVSELIALFIVVGIISSRVDERIELVNAAERKETLEAWQRGEPVEEEPG